MTDVLVRSERGLTQSIEVRDHHLTADEPIEAGGEDRGPNPYELLLSALGACTSMTVRLYAQRKGWPLELIEVALQYERVYADDSAESETRDEFLDQITKDISLYGPLNAEQRQRLLDIAERCPVQRTLQRQVRIQSRLRPGD